MEATLRKNITPKSKKELASLVVELNKALKELKKAEDTANSLKTKIKDIVGKYDLPEDEGKSQKFEIPEESLQLTIIRPEKSLIVDPELLLKEVGCDVFHKVCKIKKVNIDMNIWDLLKQEELVFDNQLLNSIPQEEIEKEQSITIRVSTTKK